MRKIRFRVWDKKERKFYYLPDPYKVIGFTEDGKLVLYGLPNPEETIPIGIEGEDLEANLWTGLKDKNGKEIYEGDIVKLYREGAFFGCGEVVGAVVPLGTSYALTDCVIKQPNGKVEKWDDVVYLFEEDAENIEVIGNVYENPELLRS